MAAILGLYWDNGHENGNYPKPWVTKVRPLSVQKQFPEEVIEVNYYRPLLKAL